MITTTRHLFTGHDHGFTVVSAAPKGMITVQSGVFGVAVLLAGP
jgi:hypothetical protein